MVVLTPCSSVHMAVDKEKLEEESVIRRFYQIILSWDYFRLIKDSKAFILHSFSFFVFGFWPTFWIFIWCFQKQQKNNGKEEAAADGAAPRLVKVKNRYKDVDDYISTYEPLIFEEAKSQIIKEKEDEEGIFNFNNFASVSFPPFLNILFSFTGLLLLMAGPY